MIILSSALTDTADEGSVKVAASLTKRIKRRHPETTVVTYDRRSGIGDIHLRLNKLLLSPALWAIVRKSDEPVLHIPFPAGALATALRRLSLSISVRGKLTTVLSMNSPAGPLARLLFRLGRGEIVTLSRKSCDNFRSIIGDRAVYLKSGVDTAKFCPADEETRQRLRQKYGAAPGKKVLTHVGHLVEGRGVRRLLEIGEDYHVFLVLSTQTEADRDAALRADLEKRPYTNIIDTYLPNIEEIYQMSDVYLFPVEQEGHCIDVPLSALEAAACGVPVVATEYGELAELVGERGFYFASSLEPEPLGALIDRAAGEKESGRESVLEYDWDLAVDKLFM